MEKETFEKANEIQEQISKSRDFIKHIRETSTVHLRMNNPYSFTASLRKEDEELIDLIKSVLKGLKTNLITYEKKDHDYSVFLFIIAMWMIVCGIVQCESAIELSNIRHELILMRCK